MKDKKKEEDISHLLVQKKEAFISSWKQAVETNLPQSLKNVFVFEKKEFSKLFDAYIKDAINGISTEYTDIVSDFIMQKISMGFPLTIMGIINNYFMSTARQLFRSLFPDSFNKRMEYLENLAQKVLNNEIVIVQYYEDYVNTLNKKFKNQTELLKRRNRTLIEFIDLATHQLQSPLWAILGFTAKLQKNYYQVMKEDGKHCINRISANVAEMHQLIEDVTAILLIDPENMKNHKLFLYDLIYDSIKNVQSEVDENFIVISEIKNVYIMGDPFYLRQLFYQILKNAALYTKGGKSGKVKIRHLINNDYNIYIEDEGIGIDDEYKKLIFKPLERLKDKEVNGTGMGLSFAQRIVNCHDGMIEILNSQAGGVCVHITLPKERIIISKKRSKTKKDG